LAGHRGARKQFVRGGAARRQERLALGREAVALAAGNFRINRRITHVVEPGERRIDDARARAVAAAEALLDRLDQFVTMARAFRDHGEQQQPQLAIIEEPMSGTSASAMPVALVTMMMMVAG